MNAKVVKAREVQVGDQIAIPQHGFRVVVDVRESTFGLDERPCIRIVYALGAGKAFENRARAAKGMSSFTQPEAGIRPLLHDEPVAIAETPA